LVTVPGSWCEFGAVFEMTNAFFKGVTRQELAKTQQNSTEQNTTIG
jgi:hypothetical protein